VTVPRSNAKKEIENGQLASMRRMRAQADLEGKSLYAVCSRGGLGPDLFLIGLAANLGQKLRQLRDVRRDPPRLTARQPKSCPPNCSAKSQAVSKSEKHHR
jgi:hypothetical protein